MKKIKCPLCDEREMIRQLVPNGNDKETAVWSCKDCHFVSFLHFDNEDIKSVRKVLKFNQNKQDKL